MTGLPAEDADSAASSREFRMDQRRYNRRERLPVVVLGGAFALLCIALITTPLWWLGLGLLVVDGLVVVLAVPTHWDVPPPSVRIDGTGITYRQMYQGPQIRRRERRRVWHLDWADIAEIVIDVHQGPQESHEAVWVIGSSASPVDWFAFSPDSVAASEDELAEALARFAPPRLRTMTDRRRKKRKTQTNRWTARRRR